MFVSLILDVYFFNKKHCKSKIKLILLLKQGDKRSVIFMEKVKILEVEIICFYNGEFFKRPNKMYSIKGINKDNNSKVRRGRYRKNKWEREKNRDLVKLSITEEEFCGDRRGSVTR